MLIVSKSVQKERMRRAREKRGIPEGSVNDFEMWNKVSGALDTVLDPPAWFLWKSAPWVVGFMFLLVIADVAIAVYYVLPRLWPDHGILVAVYVFLIVWFLFHIFYNALLCMWTEPGRPSLHLVNKYVKLDENIVGYLQGGKRIGSYQWCKKCDDIKPPRSHHCRVMDKCVLRMDHFCPWVANCVGFRNHRIFIRFITWFWLGCTIFLVVLFPYLMDAYDGELYPFSAAQLRLRDSEMTTEDADKMAWKHRGNVFYMYGMAFIAWAGLLCLHIMQWNAILGNRTQVDNARYDIEPLHFWQWFKSKEAIDKQMTSKQKRVLEHPYDLGWWRNCQEFFGANEWPVRWLFSISRGPPKGNGIVYAKRDSRHP